VLVTSTELFDKILYLLRNQTIVSQSERNRKIGIKNLPTIQKSMQLSKFKILLHICVNELGFLKAFLWFSLNFFQLLKSVSYIYNIFAKQYTLPFKFLDLLVFLCFSKKWLLLFDQNYSTNSKTEILLCNIITISIDCFHFNIL